MNYGKGSMMGHIANDIFCWDKNTDSCFSNKLVFGVAENTE